MADHSTPKNALDIRNCRILVTGGTGSFGNKVAQFFERMQPKEITIFSRDEKKQYEMRRHFPNYRYVLGDTRDRAQVDYVTKGKDIIFHAAALKQVPSCEIFPVEAVKTNILGSNNICDSAIQNGVRRVIALSTDKAVKPINAMGISKAMMEKIVISQNMQELETVFSCVRYGNVMGSRGSVIPLFLKQIETGNKITITDPNMTRFLMTLEQSVDLVHRALNHAQGGEIFVRKAPACTVLDLAKTLITKFGDGDFDRIEITGVRPGEKIDEVLVNEYEIQRSFEIENYFVVNPEYSDVKVKKTYQLGYEYTSQNTDRLTRTETIGALIDEMGDIESYGR